MTFVLSILCSVSSGILSQRMFVMLPCGGVGVRENSHTAPKCSKALNERAIKKISALDERRYCFKDERQVPRDAGDFSKDRILKRKGEFARLQDCLTVRVRP